LVGTVAIPVASVKSSAAATAAVVVIFFMAIFRKAQGVPMDTIYMHRRPKDVTAVTSAIGFDFYVMAITSFRAPVW
jgi:hypothetical protein